MRNGQEARSVRPLGGDAVEGSSFGDPVFGAQTAFRAIMRAMALPGRVERLETDVSPPKGMGPASAAVLLTLCDLDTAVWFSDADSDAARFLRFFTDAPLVEAPGDADFGFVHPRGIFPALSRFKRGDDQYPDRSATLIVEVAGFEGGSPLSLTGPGIEDATVISPLGLPEDFWGQWSENHALYPCGVDLLFTCDVSVMGLPRSVRAALGEHEVA
ncbi:MAG: phosphonate C-P lyase system protein PhnH [Hyphomicrobiales bacterium]|nr:phosphonate C-P lyase system protein PhnH [Hyphomicrobiales bacterium]